MVRIKGEDVTDETAAAYLMLYPVEPEIVAVVPAPITEILKEAGVEL